ncbi:MAG TPA: hypothetical protein VMH80_17380 [Bryobacteraceae bacterium]|nr:hypothetical protein [Bryobacteraceae bacterium]
MKTLTFGVEHSYSYSAAGIEVPVCLKMDNARNVRLHAKVDTGAADCIFQKDYADQLAIEVEKGALKTFWTATGKFDAYGHSLTLSCFNWEYETTVYFAASDEYRRNVVGRSGWLQKFRLAIIDHDTLLFISHYDDP